MKNDKLNYLGIIEKEHELALAAGERYGDYFKNAMDFNGLLQTFLKTADMETMFFVMFLSQIRKHHTLAILSETRLHHVQAEFNIRQTIEAATNAAYGIVHCAERDYAQKDGSGILTFPPELQKKRYKWVEENYKTHSDFLKIQKEFINEGPAHSNIAYAHLNFSFDVASKRGFEVPFFDPEDEFRVKTTLWFLGNLAMSVVDLFYGINLTHKKLVFVDGFIPRLKALEAENHRLKAEMATHPRLVKAMEKSPLRRPGGLGEKN